MGLGSTHAGSQSLARVAAGRGAHWLVVTGFTCLKKQAVGWHAAAGFLAAQVYILAFLMLPPLPTYVGLQVALKACRHFNWRSNLCISEGRTDSQPLAKAPFPLCHLYKSPPSLQSNSAHSLCILVLHLHPADPHPLLL